MESDAVATATTSSIARRAADRKSFTDRPAPSSCLTAPVISRTYCVCADSSPSATCSPISIGFLPLDFGCATRAAPAPTGGATSALPVRLRLSRFESRLRRRDRLLFAMTLMLSLVVRVVVDFLNQSTVAITRYRHHAQRASYLPIRATKIHDASSGQSSSDNDLAKSHDFALAEKISESLKM